MKDNINSLIGYKIGATDGELGKVVDFYFDDKKWNIRYLVVETGGWLQGRKVLISAQEISKCDVEQKKFNVKLTMDQIRHSPDIDTNMPVTRQMEEVLHRHHSWDFYWGNTIFIDKRKTNVAVDDVNENGFVLDNVVYDVHLQSAMQVSGYHIHALGGEIGHLNDYIIDDETWRITDIVIDTHNIIGGKKVVVDVRHVDALQWANYQVYLDMSIQAVENSPQYAAE